MHNTFVLFNEISEKMRCFLGPVSRSHAISQSSVLPPHQLSTSSQPLQNYKHSAFEMFELGFGYPAGLDNPYCKSEGDVARHLRAVDDTWAALLLSLLLGINPSQFETLNHLHKRHLEIKARRKVCVPRQAERNRSQIPYRPCMWSDNSA